MGRREIRGLKARVGRKSSISRGGARLSSKSIQTGEVQGRSHSVTSKDAAGGQLQE